MLLRSKNLYWLGRQKYLVIFGQNFEIMIMVLGEETYFISHFMSADSAKLVQDLLRARKNEVEEL